MSTTAKAPAAKPAATKSSGGIPAGILMLGIFAVAVCIYMFFLGSGANFEGGDNHNQPIPGNYFGMIYKGGIIVPILITCLLSAIIFTIERFLTLGKASGSGDINGFVRKIQGMLNSNDISSAIKECDKQKGSVGNVTKAALTKYSQLVGDNSMDKEQKLVALSKEVEESTSLEMPMLQKNLTILATLASVSTLLGLLGTVIGMIKSFAALGESGAPDSSALANGISEALINTALGIGTSAICIIFYNYFTARIDSMTYNIDEVGLSVSNTFATHN
jgi:biopolymer transport protein ExbB